jgi:protein SCO1
MNDRAAPARAARDYFTDTIVRDQYDRSHRFYSDLIAGRTVIITQVFTNCRSSCPIIMAQLAELQHALGERKDEVVILSISVDPILDTPKALRAYAEALQAGLGWYFLTGTTEAINTIRRRLGDRAVNAEDHNDTIVVGNDAAGTWVKLTALASTEDIMQAIADVTGKSPHRR